MVSLTSRPEALDRLRHDVGGGVPVGALARVVVEGEDVHRAVGGEGGAQIHRLAVEGGGAGGPVDPMEMSRQSASMVVPSATGARRRP